MRLHELAFACRIYGALTSYDSGLTKLRQATGENLDPCNQGHQAALFKWLNSWGCRQFSIAHHDLVAAPSLVTWANRWLAVLPSNDAQLDTISEAQINLIGNAYDDLRGQIAGMRILRNGSTSKVKYGPVGAAKTLFALRPNLCPPWDDFTLSKLGFDRSAASYSKYLRLTVSQLQVMASQASCKIADLPALLGRPESTPPKLIDEYYWVTITRGFVPPTREELTMWLAWANHAPER